MKIYNIGPTELEDYELENIDQSKYQWLVYWYKYECWEGDGSVAALGIDNKLYFWNIGHCSCYGPFEEFLGNKNDPNIITIEQLKTDIDSIHYSYNYEVTNKVLELLNE